MDKWEQLRREIMRMLSVKHSQRIKCILDYMDNLKREVAPSKEPDLDKGKLKMLELGIKGLYEEWKKEPSPPNAPKGYTLFKQSPHLMIRCNKCNKEFDYCNGGDWGEIGGHDCVDGEGEVTYNAYNEYGEPVTASPGYRLVIDNETGFAVGEEPELYKEPEWCKGCVQDDKTDCYDCLRNYHGDEEELDFNTIKDNYKRKEPSPPNAPTCGKCKHSVNHNDLGIHILCIYNKSGGFLVMPDDSPKKNKFCHFEPRDGKGEEPECFGHYKKYEKRSLLVHLACIDCEHEFTCEQETLDKKDGGELNQP